MTVSFRCPPPKPCIYEAVENYISTTYNQASAKEKNAVGFVMTIYRRRLASSFHALRHTLEDRLAAMKSGKVPTVSDAADEADTETTDAESAKCWHRMKFRNWNRQRSRRRKKTTSPACLRKSASFRRTRKPKSLRGELEKLRADGYPQTMVFTQYTDTMDFLRDELVDKTIAPRHVLFRARR
jgi:hypothetical protein